MKPSTVYWLRLESFGSPELTVEVESSVMDMVKLIMAFMISNTLNQRMQFTIARTQEQLVTRKPGKQPGAYEQDMASIFDSLDKIANMSDEEAAAHLKTLQAEQADSKD